MRRFPTFLAVASVAAILFALLFSAANPAAASDLGANLATAHPSFESASGCSPRGVEEISDSTPRTATERYEWLAATGPRIAAPPPIVTCLVVIDSWCAPSDMTQVVWHIRSHTPLADLTIGGQSVEIADGLADISCDAIRAEYAPGTADEHQVVPLTALVTDVHGQTGRHVVEINLPAIAPMEQIDEIYVAAGVSDVFVFTAPWPWSERPADQSEPFGRVALARVRTIGAAGWTYFFPLPGPPQSCCGYWCLASHLDSLEPDTDYELQAAWIWNHDDRPPYMWGEQRQEMKDTAESMGYALADKLNWSETVRFETHGAKQLAADITHDTVEVRWQASAQGDERMHTWATSPDWPGVVWVDPQNAYAACGGVMPPGDHGMKSILRGLPANTDITVTVQRRLPGSFRPAEPDQISVRTAAPPTNGGVNALDPRDIKIRVGASDVHVEWTVRGDTLRTRATVVWGEGDDRIHDDGQYYELKPASQHTELGDETMHAGVRFADLKPGTTWTLYVAREPSGYDPNEPRYPYTCMIWEITTPAGGADSFLDRYFFTTPGATAITAPDFPIDEWPWSYCQYGDPTGP